MTVETAVCDSCGAEVRDDSLFCFNCGGSVKANSDGPEPVVPDLLKASSTDPLVETPTKANDSFPSVKSGEQLPGSKPALRTAASLRKQRRAFNRQPVEVTWERPAGPAMGFIITSIVLAAGALVLILIALYLR